MLTRSLALTQWTSCAIVVLGILALTIRRITARCDDDIRRAASTALKIPPHTNLVTQEEGGGKLDLVDKPSILLNQLRLISHKLRENGSDVPLDELLLGLLLVLKYNNDTIDQDISEDVVQYSGRLHSKIVTSKAVLRGAAHYVRYACAAYGWSVVNSVFYEFKEENGLENLLSYDILLARLAVSDHTGIRVEDIIDDQWQSELLDPPHYVCLDHTRRAIVVVIRGTLHANDVLTDLLFEYTSFYIGGVSGFTHAGMLKAAEAKVEKLASLLLKEMERHPGYTVATVGHSLGAGVAALMGLLLKRQYPPINIRSYCYGPPCILSIELAELPLVRGIVKSYVLRDDLVSRLSMGHVLELQEWAGRVAKHYHKMSLKPTRSAYLDMALASISTSQLQSLPERAFVKQQQKLFPAGEIFVISPVKLGPHQLNHWDLKEESARSLQHIRLSLNMFNDHLPHRYEEALKNALVRQQAWPSLQAILANSIGV